MTRIVGTVASTCRRVVLERGSGFTKASSVFNNSDDLYNVTKSQVSIELFVEFANFSTLPRTMVNASPKILSSSVFNYFDNFYHFTKISN